MKLDELLKQNAAWFGEAVRRPTFDKVDAKTANFPQEQRERRIATVKTRIDDLERRKQEAVASYDNAIALEKAELEDLEAQQPPTPGTPPTRPGTGPTGPDKPSDGPTPSPRPRPAAPRAKAKG